MARQLYDLDPEVASLLRLETFQNKFTVKEFIEGLSEKLIERSKNSKGVFDPRPFIRTFEQSTEELQRLRKDIQGKAEDLESSVQSTESAHNKKVKELNLNFEAVVRSFENLERRINEVGNTAVRIGEQLETIDKQRKRAAEAKDLIEHYFEFTNNVYDRVEKLRKEGGREGRHKAAIIARRLNAIAKEVDIPGSEVTQSIIEKYCERLETDLLKLFDKAYRKADAKTMKHCAATLEDFNGGASCVQIYVNQHDFFISKDRLNETESIGTDESWKDLPDPDAPPPKGEPGMLRLYSEIRETVKQEAQIIQAVFPNPVVVMQVFIQRIFAQSIQSYFEALMGKAERESTLAFLRALHSAYTSTAALVEDVKAFDFQSKTTAGENVAENGNTSSSATAMTTILDQSFDDLFVPFMESNRYIERERRSLSELYGSFLVKFTKYHNDRKPIKNASMFDRMVGQITANAMQPGHEGGFGTSLLKLSGISSSAAAAVEKGQELELSDVDGELSIDAAKRMLKWHAEAIGRCVELTSPVDVPKNVNSLLRLIIECFGKAYVETALDTAIDVVNAMDLKVEPDLGAFRVIQSANEIMRLAHKYATTALIPLAASSVTIRRDMVMFCNHNMSRIEGKINEILQKLIDNIINWLSQVLSRQKKNDFKPRDDDLMLTNLATSPCNAAVDFIRRVHAMAEKDLDQRNTELFLTEVGVAFHGLLLGHFKKFPVSAAGGLILTKDINKYEDAMMSFDIPTVIERFDMLHQLGNVFIVRPEILKSILNEGMLARIDARLLTPYLQQRVDYKTSGIDQLIVDGEDSGEVAASDSRTRLRLAAIMKDLHVGDLRRRSMRPRSVAVDE